MKNSLKHNLGLIVIGMIIGAILVCGITVYAYSYFSNDISYIKPGTVNIISVGDALDDLYSIKNDLDQTDATATDISYGKKAYSNGNLIEGINTNQAAAYVLACISNYQNSSDQYAALGHSSDTSYFTVQGNSARNYFIINAIRNMHIKIILQESGRGKTATRTIAINNVVVKSFSLGMGDNGSYECDVSAGDVIKITADRLSTAVRGTAIYVCGY